MTGIRRATKQDAENIRSLYLQAFPAEEAESVAELALSLLALPAEKGVISLLAERDNTVTGHVSFSPVTLDRGSEWFGYILAPLAVLPACQKEGVGSLLTERGISVAREADASIVFVYGDPAYYGRFGFSAEDSDLFQPPCPLKHPFGWQVLALKPEDLPVDKVTLRCLTPLNKPELW